MHLSEADVERVLHGELSPSSAISAREHLSACAACRSRVDQAAVDERRTYALLAALDHDVPHVDVHVFRPNDGAHLATIGPCDAIPDLLRVDERCDVYVAEESGHMVAFGAGPRLSLVR